MHVHPGLLALPLPPDTESHLYDPAVAPIGEFKGQYRFLSNFFPCHVVVDGMVFASTEHSFNALKTFDMGQREWVASAPTPREAKVRGNDRTGRITLRPDWDTRARYEAMTVSVHAKFTANQARVDLLLSKGTALLVEGNRWHDNVWGDCSCGRSACARPGENHLGRTLMRLRHALATNALRIE